MKEKFLKLVKKVKEADISYITKATTESELTAAWQSFWKQNSKLHAEIKTWASEFINTDLGPIFSNNEEIPNPMEIVIVIRGSYNSDLTECDVFNNYRNLVEALNEIGDDFASVVAKCIENDYIPNISAEDIFSKIDVIEDEETE